ncbi:hypothetical protein [Brevibacillus dissolubilis]|uniref:hypothetical protein n=1 Tax=Brevibacillus dissolubilis TaxID=1844116 RepID=UPI001115DEC5|nr:hypothetical protein [Brevibacillus dissolubilis]
MSLTRTILGLVRNHEETSEHPKDPALKTRYYKIGSDPLLEAVRRVIESQMSDWNIVHVDAPRGELMLEKSGALGKQDMVITIFRLSPMQSAIDVVASQRGRLGDLGSSYRNILRFFEALHREVKPDV